MESGSSDTCVNGRPGGASQGRAFMLAEERNTQRIKQNYDKMHIYDCFTLQSIFTHFHHFT